MLKINVEIENSHNNSVINLKYTTHVSFSQYSRLIIKGAGL